MRLPKQTCSKQDHVPTYFHMYMIAAIATQTSCSYVPGRVILFIVSKICSVLTLKAPCLYLLLFLPADISVMAISTHR